MNIEKTSKALQKEFWPQLSGWSTRELLWLGFWSILLLVGLYALYVQVTEGHIVTGMRDHVIWGVYIVNFLFFIGIGYTGAILGRFLHLFNAEWRKPLMRMAALMTVISVIIGPLYILLCIGLLDRLYYLFIDPRLQSPIVWDVVAVMTFLVGVATAPRFRLRPARWNGTSRPRHTRAQRNGCTNPQSHAVRFQNSSRTQSGDLDETSKYDASRA